MTCARGRRSSQSTPSVGSSRARTWTLRQIGTSIAFRARAIVRAIVPSPRARRSKRYECTFQRFVYRASSRASRARTHRDGRSRGSISAMSSRASANGVPRVVMTSKTRDSSGHEALVEATETPRRRRACARCGAHAVGDDTRRIWSTKANSKARGGVVQRGFVRRCVLILMKRDADTTK